MPWDRVHDEAEVLEHVLSEELEELIAAKLGNPDARPARRPDPDARPDDRRGADAARSTSLEAGARGRFVRISDSDPEMLRYLAERGIAPGDALRGRRQAAVRRPAVRPLRRRRRTCSAARSRAAMRVEVRRVTPPPPSPAPARRPRPTALPAASTPIARSQPRSSGSAARPLRGRRCVLGPAFVAAVAYVDPGNFATNIAGGAKFGYLLLWVLLAANLMAMLIQYLSAKIGIATGPQPARAVPRALPAAGHLAACGSRRS